MQLQQAARMSNAVLVQPKIITL